VAQISNIWKSNLENPSRFRFKPLEDYINNQINALYKHKIEKDLKYTCDIKILMNRGCECGSFNRRTRAR
jgi:hypothetical protein